MALNADWQSASTKTRVIDLIGTDLATRCR
jgi:hypothetical protein